MEPTTRGRNALPRVSPLGDSAVLLTLAECLDLEANALASRVARDIRGRGLPWVSDVVPALVTVAVHFEARTVREAEARRAKLERLLLQSLARAAGAGPAPAPRTVEMPLCYEPPYAEDLLEVAAHTGLAPQEVVRIHSAATY